MPHPRKPGLLIACLVLAAALAWMFHAPPELEAPPAGKHPRNTMGTAKLIPPAATGSAESGLSESHSRNHDLTRPVAQKDPAPLVSTLLPDDFLIRILTADAKTVTIPLPAGSTVAGKVSSIQRDAEGPLRIEGIVTAPEAGRFMFQRQTVPGVAGPLVGFILFDKSDTAWRVRPGRDGKPSLEKTTADEVICRSYARPQDPQEIPPTHPQDYPIPPDENGIIQLQSQPGATAVVYLDFDGEERNFASWGYINALPSEVTNSQIYEVWKGVSEDYQPFNLNITTVRAVYDAAPEGRRIQVVVTPTTDAYPGAGGVAYVGSFNWSGEMVCWSFYAVGKNAVEVISHEVGHTLGLTHDGRSMPSEGYYLGHSGWAPIMGAGYYQTPSQWSKGEYPNANNPQDDLSIIANDNNNVGFHADDHGDTFESATWLDITSTGELSNEGVIETSADEDSFRFATHGGDLDLAINNVSFNPNLDLKAEILDSTGVIVATHDPQSSLDAVISGINLPAGDYFLRVSGVGKGDLTSGYSDYGSLGAYTITGTVSGGVYADRFTIEENSPDGTTLGTVASRADHGGGALSFAISSGNAGGTFAIDSSTGTLTVADHTLLDFEALSARWDDPATFELFVSITDDLGSVTETIRTVVMVADANEAPVFPAPSAVTIAEHLAPGTLVTTVSASDPDRFDHVTYSIAGGNTDNAFAIDAATGQITAEQALHYEITPTYTLTLRATDNLVPANTVDVTLTIDLLDIPEEHIAGTVIRTFFNGIGGSTLAALTGSGNFPGKPHSESILTSFDSGTSKGDSYGSTVRGYVIAPATGNYTFWISSDNDGELRLSPDTNPANAVVRASLAGRADPGDWTAHPSQRSTDVAMIAGQAYYIEARQKEDNEGDHVQVAWQGPGISTMEIIPGRWLAPYQEDHAPWAADENLIVREFADDGQSIGQVSFIEPDSGQSVGSYAITAGNEAGIFAINSGTGELTLADSGGLTAGDSHLLTIAATDNGSPPLTGFTTVTIQVLGLHEQLHAWWKLDETSGLTVNDDSGGNRQAYLSGGGAWIVRDAANHALQLNGINARFTYLGNNTLAGDTSFTLAAWVKVPVTHSADGMLIQQQESGGSGHIGRYLVRVRADGRVGFSVFGKNAANTNEDYQFDITSTGSIHDGIWHHVACVRDRTIGRIFIDGVEAASASGPVRMLDPALTVAVGCDARNNNLFLKATVDDVRIYSDALGSQQLVRIAGTPKVAITSPATTSADIPAGVGLMLQAAASDPDGPPPPLTWSQSGGPGTVTFGSPAAAETTATFSMPGAYVLRATASDGTNSAIDEVTVLAGVTASSPFAGFTYGGATGSQFESGSNSRTLAGVSSGIEGGGSSDAFYLLGQSFSGDFDILARVSSLTDVVGTTSERAGLIVRLGTTGEADEVSAFIGHGTGGTGHWIRRAGVGSQNIADEYPAAPVPGWCRILRAGDVVEFLHSADGISWTSRGIMTFNGEVRAGLCWSSGHPALTGSATFDNLSGFSISNIAPLVSAGDDASAVVNVPSDLTGSRSDDGLPAQPGATSVSWSVVSGPGNVTFGNPAAVVTSASCSAEGEYTLRLVADDGAVKTFDEMVLTAALLDTIGVTATDAEAAETGPDSGTFTFTRGGSLVGDLTVDFTLSGTASNGMDYAPLPANIIIPDGETTASLTIAPEGDPLVEGPESVILTINPGDYDIIGIPAEIVIADSNHAPEWTVPVITGADGQEDTAYSSPSLASMASDPDGNDLVFDKTSGPAWLVVAADGSLSGTPAAEDAGPNTFGVRVTDTGGLFAEVELAIFVQFNNVQPAFVASPVIAANAVAQVPYTGQSLAAFTIDPNLAQGDVLAYSKLAGPAWLEVAADGDLSGTASPAELGVNTFSVRVSDTAGSTADVELQITVTETILYLDTNGTDSGSGAPASVTWDDSAIWSAEPDGITATWPWIEGAKAVLSAGGDALPAAITVAGTLTLGGLAVEEGSPALSGGVLALAGAATPFVISGTADIGSEIAGSGMGLVKSGPGTLLLSGNNTYTGDTVIQNGLLELTDTGRLYNLGLETSAVITIQSGGTWKLPDYSLGGVGQLSEDRGRRVIDGGTIEVSGPSHTSGQNFTVTANGGMFRYSAAGQELTLAGNPGNNILIDGPLVFDATGNIRVTGVLEGAGSLVKTGPGTLELTDNNTLTGSVAVSTGNLLLGGALTASSGVTVETNATISGGGSIANSLTVSGTIAPGNAAGTMTTGALTLATGASLQWQVSDWAGAPGTGQDLIIADSLDLTSSTAVTLILQAETLLNFTDAPATFTLIQTASGISGFDAGKFTIDSTAIPQATGHWLPRVSGNDLVIDYTPLTPFETWQLVQFGPDAGNVLIAGDAADPDGDGTVNLLEYALGMAPETADITGIVVDHESIAGTDFLRMTVSRNLLATDITFTVQTTSDPSDPDSWTAADTFIESDTPTQLIVRDTLAGPSRFIRLRVTR